MSSIILLLLGVVIGAAVGRHFEEQDMALLTGKLELVTHALHETKTQQEMLQLPQRLEDSLVGHNGLAVRVMWFGGKVIFATPGARFSPALHPHLHNYLKEGLFTWATDGSAQMRGISALVHAGIAGAPPVEVALGSDISHHALFMDSFRTTLWTFMPLAAFAIGLLGWVAVRHGLAPLGAITRDAATITANRLDARVQTDAIPIELVEVVDALNAMLSRLDESFRRLSDYSSDLAHELRTPVCNLLTQTQVSLLQPRHADEYRGILASNAEELERLSRMIADMLFLAKAENQLIIPRQEAVSLSCEVTELFEFYEALAEEKAITLACTGAETVTGDRLMLRRAINNLLSNAVRHTPPGGSVQVRIWSDKETAAVAVENEGETIAPEHLPRLFDRFYRSDIARQRFTEGAGLGLAIARSIILAHRGSVTASSDLGITQIVLRIPF
jgi:two-component system heavy metal sensor histidine kinase CusS